MIPGGGVQMTKCVVGPSETRGKSKLCSARCRKVYSRRGLKTGVEAREIRSRGWQAPRRVLDAHLPPLGVAVQLPRSALVLAH